jgi:hypothetical protein
MSRSRTTKSETKLNLFRKIRVWALYDPMTRQINSFHKFKYQVPVPRPGSALRVVELTGFYPVPQSTSRAVTEEK